MSLIIVSGALANKYRNGGATWTRLNWVLGLRELGCRVFFVEQLDPAAYVAENGGKSDFAESANLAYFRQVLGTFGLEESAALIGDSGRETWGLQWPDLLDLAGQADLLVNITGHLTLEPLRQRIRRQVYVDLDPGYTQFWHSSGLTGTRLAGYDAYYTVGQNIGRPECPIPTDDFDWRPIRQPVVLDLWPASVSRDPHRFTTIASWRGPYGPVEYGGRTYGLKVHEFRRVLDLPRLSPYSFEVALDIHPADDADRKRLEAHGWRVVNASETVPDPVAFRRYVQESGAEFSVAQGLYVETNSGWFSDRTVRYLASGRPALVQETGFSREIPVGAGLLSFSTLEEAVAGAAVIARDYEQHCRAARNLAEELFDSDKVLSRMLDEIAL